jgi:Putative collagen-binding domain of a collagenase
MSRGYKMFIIACFVLSCLLVTDLPVAARGTGRVGVHANNRRYLEDASGNPVVIIGFGNETKNKAAILDRLKGKINYQRAYVAWWSRKQDPNAYDGGRPWPMAGGKADLDTSNEIFWANLRDYVENARDRGIIVGLTIWDGHSDLPGGKFGADSVWNAQYNIQGIQWSYDYKALVNFPNPSPQSGNAQERLVYYQRRWIDRLIKEIKAYPNVLIELDNETDQAPERWFLWWADYFIEKGNFVIATTWNSRYTISDETFSKDPRLHLKSYHSRSDEAITATRLAWNKIIVADADNKCSNLDATRARKIAWRSFLKGGHWNDFVCADTKGFPDSTKTQHYGHLLDFIKTRDVPFTEMMSSNLISPGAALAKPGLYYLAHVEGSANLDLTTVSGVLDYEWYNPRTGKKSDSGQVQGGSVQTFAPPASGDFVLWIRVASATSTNPIVR